MNKRLEITLPKSCPENWTSMSAVAGGSYCSNCQKKVIDFTDYNQKAMQDWFLLHQDEKICGRFFKSQLLVPQEHTPKSGAWTTLRTRILAALVLIFPFSLKVSSNSLKLKQSIEAAPVRGRAAVSRAFEKQALPADSIRTIKGIILDKATKAVVPQVEVRVKGTIIKSISDSKGNFQISLNKDISPVLMISLLGYQPFEQEIRYPSDKPVTIMLTQDSSVLMGEVCIVKRPGFLKRIIRPLKKNL